MNLFKCVRAFSDRIGIWKCWFLRRGKNRRTRRKTSRNKGENQQQTLPVMTSTPAFEPGPHWWEENSLTTAHPCSPSSSESRSFELSSSRGMMGKGKERDQRLSSLPTVFRKLLWRHSCFNHYNAVIVLFFGIPVGDFAEERLYRSAQRLRLRKFRLTFLVAKRFR